MSNQNICELWFNKCKAYYNDATDYLKPYYDEIIISYNDIKTYFGYKYR